MNTEEVIEFLNNNKDKHFFIVPIIEGSSIKSKDDVIEILKRGMAFEQMWKEAKEYFEFDEEIGKIEQKYFPKKA